MEINKYAYLKNERDDFEKEKKQFEQEKKQFEQEKLASEQYKQRAPLECKL